LVAGIAAAKATMARPDGMAPDATVHSYSFVDDLPEMKAAARKASAHSGKLLISNHSYQRASYGWTRFTWNGLLAQPLWQGPWDLQYDPAFGSYSEASRRIDAIAHSAPYYLPFWSAGNDRSTSASTNGAPTANQRFYYWDPNQLTIVSGYYNTAIHPPADNLSYNGGYDTMIPDALAKNVLAVGSVDDAVTAGARNLALAFSSSFSSWGPADDGRVKPDVVANGATVGGPGSGSNTNYISGSGTSYSAPNAAGSALLLQEFHAQGNGGDYMRAATLKGLIIHTAADLGNAGPDYTFGWGLFDTLAAADHLTLQQAHPADGGTIVEEELTSTVAQYELPVHVSGGTLRATLSWTDPPGLASAAHNNHLPRLVNDLDVRMSGPSGAFLPFTLNPDSPAALAAQGDNTTDNVEQIVATSLAAGLYTVTVDHKGMLDGGSQAFSLILSGHDSPSVGIAPAGGLASRGAEGSVVFLPASEAYTIENLRGGSLTWSAAADAAWVIVSPNSGVLAALNDTAGVTVSIDATAASALAPGRHVATVTLTDDDRGTIYRRHVILEVEGAQSLPAEESFEEESLPFAWSSNVTGTGEVVVVSADEAPEGAFALALRDTVADSIAVDANAEWRVNLAGQDRLWLTFWAMLGASDTVTPPPGAEPYAATASFDGLAASIDGIDWYTLQELTGLSDEWTSFSLDLDALLASKGLPNTGIIRLKFAWTGDGISPANGLWIDRLALVPLPEPAPTLALVYDAAGSQFHTFPLDNPVLMTPIGAPGVPSSAGLDCHPQPTSSFLTIEAASGVVSSLDPTTGVQTTLGTMTLRSGESIGGAAWDHGKGQLQILTRRAGLSELRTFSPETGLFGYIDAFTATTTLAGLAYAEDSAQLYSIDTATGDLVEIDMFLYEVIAVGSLGIDVAGASLGLSIDDATGTPYLLERDPGTSDTSLWRLDRQTGAARLESNLGAGWDPTSFAIEATPAPGTPWITLQDHTVAEGNAGATITQVPITISPASAETIHLGYSFASDSAGITKDFSNAMGWIAIAPGATSASIPVTILGDLLHEGDERLIVELTFLGASSALAARRRSGVTITDDDPLPKYAGYLVSGSGTLATAELHQPATTLATIAALGGVVPRGGEFVGASISPLYVWDDASNNLLAVDTGTGAVTVVGNSAPLDGGTWSGLAWDGTTSTLYALSNNGASTRLYTVALTPFAVTSVPATGQIACEECVALAADPITGELWAIDRSEGRLVRLDKGDGECFPGLQTEVSISLTEAIDGDFLGDTGDFYLAQWNPALSRAELHVIDLPTGRSYLVGLIGDGTAAQGALAATGIAVPVTLSAFALE